MSRVLKFRIWDKANKEYMILGATGLDARNGDVIDYYNEGNRLGGSEEYDVEQYTGLTDKNGKEIYEGDIVENIEGVNETAVCVWDESNAEFDFRCRDGKYTRDNVKSWLEMYKVVGNIHEPPKDFRPEHLKRMGVSISKGELKND